MADALERKSKPEDPDFESESQKDEEDPLEETLRELLREFSRKFGASERGVPLNVTQFTSVNGEPIKNLIGIKDPIVGLKRTNENSFELKVYSNGETARRNAPFTTFSLERESVAHSTKETRRILDSSGRVTLSVQREEDSTKGVVVRAVSATEEQIAIFDASGKPTSLDLTTKSSASEPKHLSFVLEDGILKAARLDGTLLQQDVARPLLEEGQSVLDQIAQENGVADSAQTVNPSLSIPALIMQMISASELPVRANASTAQADDPAKEEAKPESKTAEAEATEKEARERATLGRVFNPAEVDEIVELRRKQDALPQLKLSDEEYERRASEYYGTGSAKKEKILHLVVGPPGAGKSSAAVNPLLHKYGALLIDSDHIKPTLPGYDGGIGTNSVHLASAEIGALVLKKAFANGDNIVYPQLGRNEELLVKLIERAKKEGYRVAIHLVDATPEKSARRVYERGKADPDEKGICQKVQPQFVLDVVKDNPSKVFDRVIKEPGLVDAWTRHDGNEFPVKEVAKSEHQIPTLEKRSGLKSDSAVAKPPSAEITDQAFRDAHKSEDAARLLEFLKKRTESWKDYSADAPAIQQWLIEKAKLDVALAAEGAKLQNVTPPHITPTEYARSLARAGEGNPELVKEFAALEAKKPLNMDIIMARVMEFQKAYAAYQKQTGQLPTTLHLAPRMDADGSYAAGENIIRLPVNDFLSSEGAQRLRHTLLHESVHREQDTLIIRTLAHDLEKSQKGFDPRTKEGWTALAKDYEAKTGYALDRKFALDVITEYGDKALSKEELVRGRKLAESIGKFTEAVSPLFDRMNRIHDALVANAAGDHREIILKAIVDPNYAKDIFGAEAPEWLKKAKSDFEAGKLDATKYAANIQSDADKTFEKVEQEHRKLYNEAFHEQEAWQVTRDGEKVSGENNSPLRREPFDLHEALEKLSKSKNADDYLHASNPKFTDMHKAYKDLSARNLVSHSDIERFLDGTQVPPETRNHLERSYLNGKLTIDGLAALIRMPPAEYGAYLSHKSAVRFALMPLLNDSRIPQESKQKLVEGARAANSAETTLLELKQVSSVLDHYKDPRAVKAFIDLQPNERTIAYQALAHGIFKPAHVEMFNNIVQKNPHLVPLCAVLLAPPPDKNFTYGPLISALDSSNLTKTDAEFLQKALTNKSVDKLGVQNYAQASPESQEVLRGLVESGALKSTDHFASMAKAPAVLAAIKSGAIDATMISKCMQVRSEHLANLNTILEIQGKRAPELVTKVTITHLLSSSDAAEKLATECKDGANAASYHKQWREVSDLMRAKLMPEHRETFDKVMADPRPIPGSEEIVRGLKKLNQASVDGKITAAQFNQLVGEFLNSAAHYENRGRQIQLHHMQYLVATFVDHPSASDNLKSWEALKAAKAQRTSVVTEGLANPLHFGDIEDWTGKQKDGKAVLENGKMVLESRGRRVVPSSDLAKFEADFKVVSTDPKAGTTIIELKKPIVTLASAQDVLISMISRTTVGNANCANCVLAFIHNAADPAELANKLAAGKFRPPAPQPKEPVQGFNYYDGTGCEGVLKDAPKNLAELKALPEGVYRCSTVAVENSANSGKEEHTFILVKGKDGSGYILDPRKGVRLPLDAYGERLAAAELIVNAVTKEPISAESLNSRDYPVSQFGNAASFTDNELLKDKLIGDIYEEFRKSAKGWKESPTEAGDRLRDSVLELLKRNGIKNPAFNEERLNILFSDTATEAKMEFRLSDGTKLTTENGVFKNADGAIVDHAKVTTTITLPETMLSNPAELARTVFTACLQQASNKAPTVEGLSQLNTWTETALGKHTPLPESTITFRTGAEGVGFTYGPAASAEKVTVSVTDTGLRFMRSDGSSEEFSMREINRLRVEELKAELKNEQDKADKADKAKVAELERQLAVAQEIDTVLSNAKHPRHAEVKELLRQSLLEATKAPEAVTRAKPGGGARGRVVALTMFAGMVLDSKWLKASEPHKPKRTSPRTPLGFKDGDHATPIKAKAVKDGTDKAPEKVKAVKDGTDKAPEKVKDQLKPPAITTIPYGKEVTDSLKRLMPMVNHMRESEALKAGKPAVPIDQVALEKEWSKGEFGPESARLWTDAHRLLKFQTVDAARQLESLGVPPVAGAPLILERSASGSGLIETDETFRSRLRANKVQCSLKEYELAPNTAPNLEQVRNFANAVAWLESANLARQIGVIQAHQTSVESRIDRLQASMPGSDLSKWKLPKDATPAEIEKWACHATKWLDLVDNVDAYSEAIAAFHRATTSPDGIPGLTDFFKWRRGISTEMTFPDTYIQDDKFPGKIIRSHGHIVSREFDLPKTLDATSENLAKMQRLESWRALASKDVDQVNKQLIEQLNSNSEPLRWARIEGFETKKTENFDALRAAKNDHLQGGKADIGKFVTLHDGDADWQILEVTGGEYKLGKRTPDGRPFNFLKYGIDVQKCDKDGTTNEKGDYVKVTGFKDYMWASWYDYKGWSGLDSVQRKDSKPVIVHKDAFVVLEDNGRMRTLQGKNVTKFVKANDDARYTSDAVGFVVDVGMCLTGVGEAKAAYSVTRAAAGSTLKSSLTAGFRAGWWHTGLGTTGFLKQAIENNMPGGHTINHAREVALMIDMGLQLTPKSFQDSIWHRFPWIKDPKAAEVAAEYAKQGGMFNWALRSGNKVFQGWVPTKSEKAANYLPSIGIMFAADLYYIAASSDSVARATGDNWRDRLYNGARGDLVSRKSYLFNGEPGNADEVKKLVSPMLDHYATRLNSDLLKSTKEVIALPATDKARENVTTQAAKTFLDSKATEAARTAAAISLLTLRTDNGLDATTGGIKTQHVLAYLKGRTKDSKDLDVRVAAGDALYRESLILSANLAAQRLTLDRLHAIESSPEIKASVEQTKKQIEALTATIGTVDFGAADFSGLLMSVLRDPAATREMKLDAIASPAGPRLAALCNHLGKYVEPQLAIEQNMPARAAMYGKDSHAIEDLMRSLAANPAVDADLRSLAAQTLNMCRSDLATVNGVVLPPGKSLTLGKNGEVGNDKLPAADHYGHITQNPDGGVSIKSNATDKPIWVVRPGQGPSLVSDKWTALGPNDRVIIGDQNVGAELRFSDERRDQITRLSMQVQIDGGKPGAIARGNHDATMADLRADPNTNDGKHATELWVNKYRAALSIFDSAAAPGAENDKLKAEAAEALLQCSASGIPEVARAALKALSPERIALIPYDKLSEFRDHYFRSFVNRPPTTPAELALWKTAVQKSSDIFKDATPHQRARATMALECLLIPDASKDFKRERPTISNPPYSASSPELRDAALVAMTKINPDRAGDLATLLLIGGEYKGRKIERDSAQVRLAAAATIQSTQPLAWHDIAIKALHLESDPAVAQRLWNIEFGARRADADPARVAAEIAGLNERLTKRSAQGWLGEARVLAQSKDLNPNGVLQAHAESTDKGRLALLSEFAYEWQAKSGYLDRLKSLNAAFPERTAKEFTGPLEHLLLAEAGSLKHPEKRLEALKFYLEICSGPHSVASRDEVSLFLTQVLSHQLKNTPAKNSPDYPKAIALQQHILQSLQDFPSEAAIPALVAMSKLEGDEIPQTLKAQAKAVLDSYTSTTNLANVLARRDLAYAASNPKDAKASPFGPAATTSSLSTVMFSKLSNDDNDALTVSRTFIASMSAKPYEGPSDPRLTVLRLALKDKNELVRLTAAKLLTETKNEQDLEPALRVLIEINKHSLSNGAQREAGIAAVSAPKELLHRIFNEPSINKRPDSTERANLKSPQDNVSYQKFFEQTRRSINENKANPPWTPEQYKNAVKELNLPLLCSPARSARVNHEVKEARNKLGLGPSKKEVQAAELSGVEAVWTKTWGEFDDLIAKALNPASKENERELARKALIYIVRTGGTDFYSPDPRYRLDRTAEAVDRSVAAISIMAKQTTFGKGELDEVLKLFLTQESSLSLKNKISLAEAMDSLANKGTAMSRESAVAVAILALETELRFGPKPDSKDYDSSVSYQKLLLSILGKYGNQQLIPALDYLLEKHPNQSIRDQVKITRTTVATRASEGLIRLVDNMLKDPRGEYSPIRHEGDPRIPLIIGKLSGPIDQRLAACEILLNDRNKGINLETRMTAWTAYSRISLNSDLKTSQRLEIALRCLDKDNVLSSPACRQIAAKGLATLALYGDPKSAAVAKAELQKLDDAEASAATSTLLETTKGNFRWSPTLETKERAFDILAAMEAKRKAAGKASLITDETIPTLVAGSIRGSDKALSLLDGLPPAQRSKIAPLVAAAFDDYVSDISKRNKEITELRENAEKIYKRQNLNPKDLATQFQPVTIDPTVRKRFEQQILKFSGTTSGAEGQKPNPKLEVALIAAYCSARADKDKTEFAKLAPQVLDVLKVWSNKPLEKNDSRTNALKTLITEGDDEHTLLAVKMLLGSPANVSADDIQAAWQAVARLRVSENQLMQTESQILLDKASKDTLERIVFPAFIDQSRDFGTAGKSKLNFLVMDHAIKILERTDIPKEHPELYRQAKALALRTEIAADSNLDDEKHLRSIRESEALKNWDQVFEGHRRRIEALTSKYGADHIDIAAAKLEFAKCLYDHRGAKTYSPYTVESQLTDAIKIFQSKAPADYRLAESLLKLVDLTSPSRAQREKLLTEAVLCCEKSGDKCPPALMIQALSLLPSTKIGPQAVSARKTSATKIEAILAGKVSPETAAIACSALLRLKCADIGGVEGVEVTEAAVTNILTKLPKVTDLNPETAQLVFDALFRAAIGLQNTSRNFATAESIYDRMEAFISQTGKPDAVWAYCDVYANTLAAAAKSCTDPAERDRLEKKSSAYSAKAKQIRMQAHPKP